jgi:hypothetical protein
MTEGYYYLITSLPELSLTDKNYDLQDFKGFITEQLTPSDYGLLQILFYPYDIENLVNLIKKTNRPWQLSGNYSREEMESMLSLPDTLPAFMQAFLADTRKLWDRMSPKKMLNTATAHFIDWSHNAPNAFLRKWLYFDQNLKNLLIWLNCIKFGLDPDEEVLGSHYEAEYLRKIKADEIDLSAWDFQFREVLRHYDNPDIALRELIINEMRWHYLDEQVQNYPFGIEPLLAYAIRLQLINRNFTDTEDIGNRKLGELLSGVTHDYQIPETFARA